MLGQTRHLTRVRAVRLLAGLDVVAPGHVGPDPAFKEWVARAFAEARVPDGNASPATPEEVVPDEESAKALGFVVLLVARAGADASDDSAPAGTAASDVATNRPSTPTHSRNGLIDSLNMVVPFLPFGNLGSVRIRKGALVDAEAKVGRLGATDCEHLAVGCCLSKGDEGERPGTRKAVLRDVNPSAPCAQVAVVMRITRWWCRGR